MKIFRRRDTNGAEFFIDENGNRVDAATARAAGIGEATGRRPGVRQELNEAAHDANGNLSAAGKRLAEENAARVRQGIAVDEAAAVETWKLSGLSEKEAALAAGQPVRNVADEKAAGAKPLIEAWQALGLSEKEATLAGE